ncbi:hypothetical protein SAMN05660841_02846 [Sphingobacterium nematocida]|uniref:CHAP domain-containing protein n=1 Tax=Sphingobacterium nematocida TaxID=1513896 RepID=A0A1T5EX74_9SPHI|nr:hypothetical protein SAMN05660841_02846 [Sphingobacterium nematocida]
MATMYSLFFGLLFTVICGFKGDRSGVLSSLFSLKPRVAHTFLLDQESTQRTGTKWSSAKLNQGLVARLNCLLISGNKTTEGWKPSSAKLNSLRSNRSDCSSEIIDNSLRLAQPRPFYQNNTSPPLQSEIMSPVKILTIAMGGTNVRSECSSDDFCFFLGKRRSPSGDEDKRDLIIQIAGKELGTHEATGNNDGNRVEQYLHYTNLGKGYNWCASFLSWCYGQAGLTAPRNPWAPALFPKARQILKKQCQPADVFGIYGAKVRRINHVGLVKEISNDYLISIEGNSNNRVESRRRHLRTIYALAKWVN